MAPIDAAPLAYGLLIITCLISAYAWFVDEQFFADSVFHTGAIRHGHQWHRLVTSGFLHGSPLHLAVNMYVLWMFGTAVEAMFGTVLFALIYFGSELTSSLFALWFRRRDKDYTMVGASGAIAGIVVAFCLNQPFTPLYLFGILPMPAIVAAIAFIGWSIFSMGNKGRTAHEAHLGGAIGGALIMLLLASDKIAFFA